MLARKQSIWIERFNLDCVLQRLAVVAEDLDVGSYDELLEPLGVILDYLDLAASRGPLDSQSLADRWVPWKKLFRCGRGEPATGPTIVSEAQLRRRLRVEFLALQKDNSLIGPFKDLAREYLALRKQHLSERPHANAGEETQVRMEIEEACRQDQMEQLLRDILEHTRSAPCGIVTGLPEPERATVEQIANLGYSQERANLVWLQNADSGRES